MTKLDELPDHGSADYPSIYGRALRFVLVDLIRQHHTMSIAQMVDELAAQGHVLRGRPSKVISDALRWEQARGRVVRRGRGIYAYGRPATTTERRIRIFAAYCRTWLAAVTRSQIPPPTPQDPRRIWTYRIEPPERAPWENTAWLWAT